jgi:hypothetical protein
MARRGCAVIWLALMTCRRDRVVSACRPAAPIPGFPPGARRVGWTLARAFLFWTVRHYTNPRGRHNLRHRVSRKACLKGHRRRPAGFSSRSPRMAGSGARAWRRDRLKGCPAIQKACTLPLNHAYRVLARWFAHGSAIEHAATDFARLGYAAAAACAATIRDGPALSGAATTDQNPQPIREASAGALRR